MERSRLGSTGLAVSRLGFGAASIGFLETAQPEVDALVGVLIDAGVNLIDTSSAYAGSEEALGAAIARRRDDLVLVSKCGRPDDGLPGAAWSARLVRTSVDRTLKRLRTEHVDVMLLHSCSLDVLKAGEALGELVRAKDAGKVRFVGYSGDDAVAAHAATLTDVAVVETSINLCDQRNVDVVLPVARAHDVGVIVKRPLANAAWRPLDELPAYYREYAAPYHARLAAMGLAPAALGFSDADWPEIALRFSLSWPGVATAIVGTTNAENARENVDAASRGPLPAPTVEKIRAAFAAAQARKGETWRGLT